MVSDQNLTISVSVIGLDYIGLSIANLLAARGFRPYTTDTYSSIIHTMKPIILTLSHRQKTMPWKSKYPNIKALLRLASCILWCLLPLSTVHANTLLLTTPVKQPVPLPAPLLDDLGSSFNYRIKADSPLAQRYFDQGMLLFYGFDYGEAVRSFQGAIATDPRCSMCYVGLALALGSQTNTPIQGNEVERAKLALSKAEQTNVQEDPQINAYIDALHLLYAAVQQKSKKSGTEITHILIPIKNNRDFSDALWKMTSTFKQDPNIWSLYAYSLFDVNDWIFRNKLLQPRIDTLKMRYAIDRALLLDPNHPGALHYLVHLEEFSSNPEAVLPYAERLGKIYASSEHLAHMPSHIYFILGDYTKAVKQNLLAIQASDTYHRIVTEQGFQPVTNYLEQHNYYFLLTDTLMAGLKKLSLETVNTLEQLTPPTRAKQNHYLERFYTLRYAVIARFGLWDELKKLSPPDSKLIYANAIWYYVNGLAYAQQDNPEKADEMLQNLVALRSTKKSKTLSATYQRNIRIAAEILTASIATQKKDFQGAILAWRNAVNAQFNYGSGDPPSWYLPCYQGLGYAYLRAGDIPSAIFAFEADLAIHPRNGWSLFGLKKAYHSKQADAFIKARAKIAKQNQLDKEFKAAWQEADVTLPIASGSDIFLKEELF